MSWHFQISIKSEVEIKLSMAFLKENFGFHGWPEKPNVLWYMRGNSYKNQFPKSWGIRMNCPVQPDILPIHREHATKLRKKGGDYEAKTTFGSLSHLLNSLLP